MVGKYGQPSGFAYPTSKFAVNGLTLSLAREPVSYTHLDVYKRQREPFNVRPH